MVARAGNSNRPYVKRVFNDRINLKSIISKGSLMGAGVGGSSEFISAVAGNPMTSGDLLQRRALCEADLPGERAASMEGAAPGDVQQAGRFTFDDILLHTQPWVGDGGGGDQRPPVRMTGPGEELFLL